MIQISRQYCCTLETMKLTGIILLLLCCVMQSQHGECALRVNPILEDKYLQNGQQPNPIMDAVGDTIRAGPLLVSPGWCTTLLAAAQSFISRMKDEHITYTITILGVYMVMYTYLPPSMVWSIIQNALVGCVVIIQESIQGFTKIVQDRLVVMMHPQCHAIRGNDEEPVRLAWPCMDTPDVTAESSQRKSVVTKSARMRKHESSMSPTTPITTRIHRSGNQYPIPNI